MRKSERFLCLTCDVEIQAENDFQYLTRILKLLKDLDVNATFFIEFSKGNYQLLKEVDLRAHILEETMSSVYIFIGVMVNTLIRAILG